MMSRKVEILVDGKKNKTLLELFNLNHSNMTIRVQGRFLPWRTKPKFVLSGSKTFLPFWYVNRGWPFNRQEKESEIEILNHQSFNFRLITVVQIEPAIHGSKPVCPGTSGSILALGPDWARKKIKNLGPDHTSTEKISMRSVDPSIELYSTTADINFDPFACSKESRSRKRDRYFDPLRCAEEAFLVTAFHVTS